MKILIASDIHIWDYQSYNKNFDGAIPSRLINYLKLGRMIENIAQEQKVDDIILAGDILDGPVCRPHTINIASEFLSNISKVCKVHMIHGQHDLDTKAAKHDPRSSILTSVSATNNRVNYVHDKVINISKSGETISLYLLGWEPSIRSADQMRDADIFVGHGIVASTKDSYGYVFGNGFSADDLSVRYKASIIGDLHQKQILCGNVLVPGTPLQNSFKDAVECGVWILDTESWEFEFFEMADPSFPTFITVSDLTKIDPKDNYFFRGEVIS